MIGHKKGRGRRGAGEGVCEKDKLFKWSSTSTSLSTTNNYFMFINDEI